MLGDNAGDIDKTPLQSLLAHPWEGVTLPDSRLRLPGANTGMMLLGEVGHFPDDESGESFTGMHVMLEAMAACELLHVLCGSE